MSDFAHLGNVIATVCGVIDGCLLTYITTGSWINDRVSAKLRDARAAERAWMVKEKRTRAYMNKPVNIR